MDMKALDKVIVFFRTRQESTVLEDYKLSMTMDDKTKVTSVSNSYVSLEDEEGEWENDVPFEDMSDAELEELAFLIDSIEADEEKTFKRISD